LSKNLNYLPLIFLSMIFVICIFFVSSHALQIIFFILGMFFLTYAIFGEKVIFIIFVSLYFLISLIIFVIFSIINLIMRVFKTPSNNSKLS